MKFKRLVPFLIIIFLTFIGYTLQPLIEPFEENFPAENIVDEIDFKPEIEEFLSEFETYLSTRLQETNSVGAAVAIVYKGQVVVLKPYGVKKAHSSDSIDIHTVFRLASVSKGFAGVLGSLLDYKNMINLDTTVKSYLPDFKLKKKENETALTVRNVLSHSTGVIAHAFDPSIESGVSYDKIYHSFNTANVSGAPGTRYDYQNALFSLIDTILHKKTKQSYSDLMTSHIFKPLGMTDASVTEEGFTASGNYAYPHKYSRSGYYSAPLNKRYYTTKPAAGVNASISDMAAWLQALLGYRQDVIPQNVLVDISVPLVDSYVKYISSTYWGKINKKQYGLGWRIISAYDNTIMYHGGFVDGYRAEVAYCPEKNIGIAFLLNSPNIVAAEVVPRFMQMFIEFQKHKLDLKNQDLLAAAE